MHHLGLYREPSTLEPVEYYNNLPNRLSSGSRSVSASDPEPVSKLAIVLDPVIATGGTCSAAIQTLREWGARRIVVLSVIAAADGIARAARQQQEWSAATSAAAAAGTDADTTTVEFWVAGVDADLTGSGMVRPGLGDVGDRLFLTIGK